VYEVENVQVMKYLCNSREKNLFSFFLISPKINVVKIASA